MKGLISSSTSRGADLKCFDHEPGDLQQFGTPLEIQLLFNNTRLCVADESSKTVFVAVHPQRVASDILGKIQTQPAGGNTPYEKKNPD
jgi:hypothetical protein